MAPSDWNSLYSKCLLCGGRSHPSGTEDCDCLICIDCDEAMPPTRSNIASYDPPMCETCWDERNESEDE